MPQSIRLWGATYSNVPYVDLPKSTTGTARFTDTTPTTAVDSDVVSGKIYIKADGSQSTGTLAFATIRTGTSTPSASLGVNGDIYIKTG